MSLYQKYRPKDLESMFGNKDTLDILRADINKEERPHVFLITGPVGCGKTTIARIISRMVGCQGRDLIEINSADFRGIDTVREIIETAKFRPIVGSCKAWLIDECHKLTNDAQNALLKALEECPKHVYYILATTDPMRLLETVRSRCSAYAVHALDERLMFRLLRHTAKAEGVEIEREVLDQIVLDSEGHPRTALQILDQTLSAPPENRLAVAKRQAEQLSQTIELCRALHQQQGWKKVANVLQGLRDEDPENVRRAILGYCSAILIKGDDVSAARIMEQMIEPIFYTGFPGLVFACYSALKLNKD